MDATITSENVLRRSSIDNVVDHLHDASLVLEDFFSRSMIPTIIKCMNSRSLWSSFRWSTMRSFPKDPALSIGNFQKVQLEVIYFPYVVGKSEMLP